MRFAVVALALVLALLTGAAEAQLRSTSLKETNDKARKEFEKRNEKTRQAIVIPEKPSNLPAFYGPTAARDAVETACQQAAKSSKQVFLWVGGPPCGCCAAFFNYHYLDDAAGILEKYYVIVHIDAGAMPDGEATFNKYAKLGSPAWVILSPQKKVIVDSYAPAGNVGYPLSPDGMAYYFAALKKATPAITDAELRWLTVPLNKAADMRSPWQPY